MSRPKIRCLALLVLVACVPAVARAQVEGEPENSCRNGLFTHDAAGFRPGKVAGAKGARVHFYDDTTEDCPGAGAKCREKSYLIPGDDVIVSRKLGDYVCAWFPPKKGSATVGWLPAGSVTVSEADKSPPAARWLGEWEYGIQSLDIKRGAKAGALRVVGEAYWRGLGDNVHVGEVEFEAEPMGNVLTLEENEDLCSVTMRLVGDHLVVGDNLKCGGVNVTFNGVYRKKQPARAGTKK